MNGRHRDNWIGNLCWGTPKQNGQDRVRHGTQRNARGESNPGNKLTTADVLSIIARADCGEDQTQIAADHGIRQQLVSRLKRGRAWKHITQTQLLEAA